MMVRCHTVFCNCSSVDAKFIFETSTEFDIKLMVLFRILNVINESKFKLHNFVNPTIKATELILQCPNNTTMARSTVIYHFYAVSSDLKQLLSIQFLPKTCNSYNS